MGKGWTAANLPAARITRSDTPPRAPEPSSGTTPPPPAPVPVEASKRMQFRYEVATGLHAEQFPTRFRLVVMGPLPELPTVEAALQTLQLNTPCVTASITPTPEKK